MQDALQWLPDAGAAQPLIILLHDEGQEPETMTALARALRGEFTQSAVLAPRRQAGDTVPAMHDWIRGAQQRLGVSAAATALGGLGAGADAAWAVVQAHDGIAGRALLFDAAWPTPPAQAPRLTTLHLLHGGADAKVPPANVRAAIEQLGALQGDATLDVAHGVGRELHPALIERLLFRLRHHIPMRTWREALGTGPAMPDGASTVQH